MESVSQKQQSEFFILVKEIMSLHRERRELLASLTPGLSVWKRRGVGEETLVSRFAGKDYTEAEAPVQVSEVGAEPSSTVEQLGGYFDSVLQDMEELSHRMLSMAYVVVKPDGAALSSYMADELVISTSRIMDACKELYKDTDDNEQAEEVQKNAFLDFYMNFLEEPLDYENELALLATEEEKEDYKKEVEKEKKRRDELDKENMVKLKRWQEQQKETEKYEKEKKKKKKGKGKGKEFELMEKDEEEKEEDKGKEKGKEKVDPDLATVEYLNKGMDFMEKLFTDHRVGWNDVRSSKSLRCGDFRDKTTLSPMHFTHYTTDAISSSCGVTESTLQIYSFQILELKNGLKWPLKLYGMVAARDTVDRNRNIVFSRSERNYQDLSENGFLCLTGPTRAIVALDFVDFEVELNIEEGEESQGKELITLSKRYDGAGSSLMFENSLCKAVLKLEQLPGAVQATILGVCVVEGQWPFEYGCRVVCCVADAPEGVVLKEVRGKEALSEEEVHVGSNGYLHLSRNVVSVQSQGKLVVVIKSYNKSDHVSGTWKTDFTAKQCQISESESKCSVGTRKLKVVVKVVVAWSLLVKEKRDLLLDCPAVEP